MKAEIDSLQATEVFTKKRVLQLQKELSKVQSELVGIRENLRTMKEKHRRSELAKVVPVYGQREKDIDHLREVIDDILPKI